jgi:hypothetical protein
MLCFTSNLLLQARWLISGDIQFERIGRQTGINWLDQYIGYKKLLTQKQSTPSIKALFDDLNADLFGTRPRVVDPMDPVIERATVDTGFEDLEREFDEEGGNAISVEPAQGSRQSTSEDASAAQELEGKSNSIIRDCSLNAQQECFDGTNSPLVDNSANEPER